ncbi:c-type cytochrome [Paenirhodobacter sp.]|uniref:c-type cytochrome n=1 Tax=Paenirhodobacter sp. TaxID=1965326 RepID=UPI003B3FE421
MRVIPAFVLPVLLMACTLPDSPGSARQDYETYCATCHGTGTTPGPLAREMKLNPTPLADLTQMNEGNFPEARVMSKIVGYREHGRVVGAQPGQMPAFDEMLEGRTVLYDTGDGIDTPTPLRLVRLMEYIKSIQE